LVVVTATAEELLGSSVDGTSAQPGSSAQKSKFELARQGHDALFKLNKDDAQYVDGRIRELATKKIVPKTKGTQNGLAIGAHVRRGDRHPLEFQYRDSYVPLNLFAEAARNLIDERFAADKAAKQHSFMIMASDDPMVYESLDFTGSSRAQERIKLANKPVVQHPNPDRHVMRKYIDESFGWEGGFFAAMFWNLGQPSASASSAIKPPSAETIRLRSLVGRAYMMDLAVLADASDFVLCTASAVGCRLLAVMMGWDSAMTKGNWINIDAGAQW
jgi:hypothetical protein